MLLKSVCDGCAAAEGVVVPCTPAEDGEACGVGIAEGCVVGVH